MTFANEQVLFLLPFSVFPAAVYFFIRLKKKKIVFPSLVVFRGLEPGEIVRANRLKYAVLFLRCLFLFFLISAFSRPYADWKLPGLAASGRLKEDADLLILSDESYSMSALIGGKSVFYRSHELARKIMEDLSDRSAVSIVSFSAKAGNAGEFMTPAEALEKIPSETVFSWSGTDYGPAFEKARELLSSRPGRKKIIFLASDNSRNGLRGVLKGPPLAGVFSADFGKKPLNFWFEEIKTSRWRSEKGQRLEISGKLRSSASFSGRTRIRYCGLSSCGNWRNIEFKKEKNSAFKLSLESSGNCGYLEVSGDDLAADDKHYLCPGIGSGKAVFLYSGRDIYTPGRPAYFAREIFTLLKTENPVFDADFFESGTVDPKKLSGYSRIFFFSVSPSEVLRVLAESKTPFFLVPQDPENDFALLKKRFRGLEGRMYSGEFSLAGPAGKKFLDSEKYELDRIYVKKIYALANPETVNSLLSVKAGNAFYPGFFKISAAAGESYVLSFSADILNSNIALKPVFPDLLKKTAENDQAEENSSFFIGASPFPGKQRPSTVFSFKGGSFLEAGGPEFKCAVPGVYRGDFGEETLYFSCNPDPGGGESSLEKAENTPWENIPAGNFMEEFRSRAYKTEIFNFLVLFAAAALALENFILWKYF